MRIELKDLFTKPVIIGHRGFRAAFPENTLMGFHAAAGAGADMVELDVQLSADGELMVIHDEELSRTTDGKGLVKDHPRSRLDQLDAGSWFHPRFTGERLPVLEEVLEAVLERVGVNIEIKYDPRFPEKAFEAAEKVVDCIGRRRGGPFVLVSCFHGEVLRRVFDKAPDLHLGVLTYKNKKDFLANCKALNAFSWNPHHRYFDENELQAAHEAGFKVLPYTVNSPEDMERVLKMGADGLFTDDPVLGKRIVGDRLLSQ